MSRILMVVDDDIELVSELRRNWYESAPDIKLLGPPELRLDLQHIREGMSGTSGIVLDLNIGGSGTYGKSILRKIARELEARKIPVIIWSKYLSETTLFEKDRVVRLNQEGLVESQFLDVTDGRLSLLKDGVRIDELKKKYPGTCAFVRKTVPNPVALLNAVLRRLGLVNVGETANEQFNQ